jgi:preprotein translocase subunit SecA
MFNEKISSNPKCLLILNKGQKIPRNEKCPATGKKFKQCCGAL